ncbi:patched domain-containing protein 3-like [Centruroides sculpturatus]|uniref:patched domain-containing protein 3-like n=1 Tax=Centruroides sculpturatus TaxID=218467 RepID=UPI000C6E6635|nr:patched domain-containing protein 3-like [Centruroides sculpturatus]
MRISTKEDYFNVIVADSGKIFDTKLFVESTFSYNSQEFSDQIRAPDINFGFLTYIMRKDEGNMFDKNVLSDVRLIDEVIQNVTVDSNGKQIHYLDICSLNNNKCFQNPIIEVMSEVGVNSLLQKRKKLKYPIDIDLLSFTYKIYFVNLGGVTLDNDNFVENFNAVMLYYSTDEKNEKHKELFDKWSFAVYDRIQKCNFTYVKVFPNSKFFVKKEFGNQVNRTKPKIGGLVVFMIIFSILFCMSNSWVRSKPVLGVASVISAGLAVVSSFGLMSALGIENISWNATIPYLVLVTEIDDAFVLIGCWRITNPKQNVEKRMEATYCEAGISITLTSLTNFISYCIGMMSPFPVVRIFCYYTATCIVFTFLYQMTFFGGCLALSGYREERYTRSVVCFTGEEFEENRTKNNEFEDEAAMAFFRDVLGKLLSNPIVKIIVGLIYVINLSIGILGAHSITHGIKFENLFSKGSVLQESSRIRFTYFTEYSYPFHIIINKTLDYSDIKVQESIENLLKKFEQHPHVAEEQNTVSWLKFYKEFQNNPVAKFSLDGYNMSNKHDFIDGLRNVFFKLHAAKSLSNDVVFNSDGTDILYSRFFVMGKNLNSSQIERDTLKELWEIAEKSEIPVLVHCIKSSIINQGIIIEYTIYQLFWITAALLTIIYFLMVPNLLVALIVSICVVSSILETLGYMSLWGVNVDIFSMMNLILCVGFSVNYPCHMSYAYITSSEKRANEKMRDSLYRIGFSVIQGSLSTGLGILILYSDVYFLSTFVKIVVLIAVETAFHALIFIPVV